MDTNSLKEKALRFSNPSKLSYTFIHPPLLVGGMALMYHGLRKSGKDIDFILHPDDHKALAQRLAPSAIIITGDHHSSYKTTPEFVDLFGDHGIIVYDFELWDNIVLFGYQELLEGALKEENFLVIGLEKLLLLCSVRGVYDTRYLDDAKLIAKELTKRKYAGFDDNSKNKYWDEFTKL